MKYLLVHVSLSQFLVNNFFCEVEILAKVGASNQFLIADFGTSRWRKFKSLSKLLDLRKLIISQHCYFNYYSVIISNILVVKLSQQLEIFRFVLLFTSRLNTVARVQRAII